MEERLKARQLEMLRCLAMSGSPLEIGYFQEQFARQERTIRYDMERIREFCASYGITIRRLQGKGYYIPVSQKEACARLLLQESTAGDGRTAVVDDRLRLQKLYFYLFIQKGYVTGEKLASAFFVSRSTLKKLLEQMERQFAGRFWVEGKKSVGYRLAGEEITLRRLAADFIAARLRGYYRVEEWFWALPEECRKRLRQEDVSEIGGSIKRLNARYNIWISNDAYLYLLSYCLVRRLRLRLGKKSGCQRLLPTGNTACDDYARELLQMLSDDAQGQSREEISWLMEILAEKGIHSGRQQVEKQVLDRAVERILSHIEEVLGVEGFTREGLYKDLLGHLTNFLRMGGASEEAQENDYILQEVKTRYRVWYELARECALLLEEETGLVPGVLEICYLAVYIYKNSVHRARDRKNVLVVCATGKGLSHLLALRLKNVFPMIRVVGEVSYWQLSRDSDFKNVDFIISTILLDNMPVPVVRISHILSEEDIGRIRDFQRYGRLMDKIPMNLENEASLLAGRDPYGMRDHRGTGEKENLSEAAIILSKLFLTLMEYTSSFPPQYQMGRDALMGMIIHLSMALPRWLTGDRVKEDEEALEGEYGRMREKHPEIFTPMEKFFSLIEEMLGIELSKSERMAFFLYIVEEK